jgi:hypothetical protein
MDKRILKTILVAMSMIITSLLVPVFGQWYKQQSGIDPMGFYFITFIGSFSVSVMSILKIWGEIK